MMHFAAQTHVDNSFGNSLAFTSASSVTLPPALRFLACLLRFPSAMHAPTNPHSYPFYHAVNNTYGTHTLLEACRKYGKLGRFVNISTDEVYGETSLGRETGLTENSRLEPTNPYSAAKAGAEMMARAYYTSYKMPVVTTRGNNVYGPHQFPEKMIPKFTLLASRGAALPIHGDGGATRSYLYVEDVAEAFDVVLHRGVPGEVYNIGTQKERTVNDVARDICALFNLDADATVQHVRDRAFNDQRYYICDNKLAQLGWRERTTWEEGLKKTVDWYLKHGLAAYWDNGNVEAALQPHPVMPAALCFSPSENMLGGGASSGALSP